MRNDYLLANHATLDQDVAVQLCCLEIRYFFKDMPQIALDKKSNLEYLEREVEFFEATNLACDNNLDFTTIEPAYSHPTFSLYEIYE